MTEDTTKNVAELRKHLLDPYMPKEPLMQGAWVACLHWALSSSEIRARFEMDTGIHWKLPTSPIEQMIDEATGAQDAFIVAFAKWLNDHIWGTEDSSLPLEDEP